MIYIVVLKQQNLVSDLCNRKHLIQLGHLQPIKYTNIIRCIVAARRSPRRKLECWRHQLIQSYLIGLITSSTIHLERPIQVNMLIFCKNGKPNNGQRMPLDDYQQVTMGTSHDESLWHLETIFLSLLQRLVSIYHLQRQGSRRLDRNCQTKQWLAKRCQVRWQLARRLDTGRWYSGGHNDKYRQSKRYLSS